MAPLVMLRHPVQRAISHFHFAKTLTWTKGMEIRKLSLSEYLKNPKEMLNTRGVWQDGQAAVSWFTGTHLANWAAKLRPDQVIQREEQSLNWTAMLDLALENLHNSLWIGILEKMDQSLTLLEYQTGLHVKMGHANRNSRSQANQPLEVTEKLRRLMPMDMFLYEYANQLHDLRWRVYMNIGAEKEANDTQHNASAQDQLKHKEHHDLNVSSFVLPKYIYGCQSSRYVLRCPQERIRYQLKTSQTVLDKQQGKLLPYAHNYSTILLF